MLLKLIKKFAPKLLPEIVCIHKKKEILKPIHSSLRTESEIKVLSRLSFCIYYSLFCVYLQTYLYLCCLIVNIFKPIFKIPILLIATFMNLAHLFSGKSSNQNLYFPNNFQHFVNPFVKLESRPKCSYDNFQSFEVHPSTVILNSKIYLFTYFSLCIFRWNKFVKVNKTLYLTPTIRELCCFSNNICNTHMLCMYR